MKIYTTCDVLIVDDDKIMCEILKTRLNNLNISCDISCDISYDGFNVFDKLFINKNLYKIILVDFEMKGLNGPATIKWIRNNKYWGILVGHTAHNIDDYIKKFIELV
jgi:CheY-like chemotaxis protein